MRLILLAAIWGASFLFMRIAAQELTPSALMFGRVGIAAVFLVVVVRGPWTNIGRITIVGALNSALPFVLLAYAAKTMPASTLSVLNATAPAFATIIGAVITGKMPRRIVVVGVVLGMAGVTICVGSFPAASFAALAAAFCYGLASHLPSKTDPALTARGSMVAATALLFIPALSGPLEMPTLSVGLSVVALGVVCTGVAYLLYFRLIRDSGPTGALSVTFLVPIFAILWSALFLDEDIHARVVVGGALVMAGTFFTTRRA
jgi:drug/metabolite transporter (DMT)-like permease